MHRQFTAPITYFLEEGKSNLDECLKIAYQGAKGHKITKIVIFTGRGDGVRMALERYTTQEDYKDIRIVAVTFAQGKQFLDENKNAVSVEISEEDQRYFLTNGVSIVRANLPFDPIVPAPCQVGILGADLGLIDAALSIFGGSMSLCVQAIALACDAGYVDAGEHVVGLTSDTAIIAQATPTRYLLSDFVIREILCKPAILTIGRNEHAEDLFEATERVLEGEQKVLPEGIAPGSEEPH